MKDGLIGQNIKAFSYSALGGLGVSCKLFLLDATAWVHVAGEWIIRLIGISVVTLVSGIIGAAAADIYKHYIKPKLFAKKSKKLPNYGESFSPNGKEKDSDNNKKSA